MSALNVTIVQADLQWHDASGNRDHFEGVIDGLGDPGDLILLPEMFTTGFTTEAEAQAERSDGPSVTWMRRIAAERQACLAGSLIIEDEGRFYNRFILMRPDGSSVTYDKRHLFSVAGEDRDFAAGTELITFELGGFRICPLICYDLRFPVWSRNRDSYDLLIFVANWPTARHLAWETLIRARAIENQAFVAGVNRVGTDGNGHPYGGGSAVIDFLGHDLANLGDEVGVATAALDMSGLTRFRSRFPFHRDADDFQISR
ncbi:MAG: omega-amidase [Chlamydiales bacterium]|jgi:omega-amidase